MCARARRRTATVAKMTGVAAAVGSGEHSTVQEIVGGMATGLCTFVSGLLPHSAGAPVGQSVHAPPEVA